MNPNHLNNQNSFRAWLNDVKLSIYLMSNEQREQFKALVYMALERTGDNAAMQASYDLQNGGVFTQVDGEAENVVLEECSENQPT